MTRRTFTKEFKMQAVQLCQQQGMTVARVCRDLGISNSALQRWVKEARESKELAFPGHGKQLLTPDQEEIKRLKRENEILREEREILKKATAFFAREKQ